MPLYFNTPVCQHWHHTGMAVPAIFRLENPEYGVIYYCGDHPKMVYWLTHTGLWSAHPINQYTQPAQEQHVDR